MDFVLVSLLTASFLIDWCYAEITTPQDNENCYSACPAGYRSSRKCDDEKYTCKICQKGTFTEIYNTHGSCLTCTACNSDKHGIELQPCVHNRNTLCGCEKGYYNMGRPEELMCTKCFSVLSKKCKNCKKKECQDAPDCRKYCPEAPSSSPPVKTSTPVRTSITPNTTTSNPVSEPVTQSQTHEPELIPLAVGMMVLLLLLVVLLSFFSHCCWPHWTTDNDAGIPADDPELNEEHSHRSNSPPTLAFTIYQDQPNMALLQCLQTPDHPTHITPLVPKYKAARQEEHSGPPERWPAILLYAIIKEVPLRRWKEFLRLLKLTDQQLDQVDMEVGLGLGEKQYQMLRLWSQRPSASLDEVYSALHHMDLSGCAQLLQEDLEKLQWTTEQMQDFTGCRHYAGRGFIGTKQDI